jgi:hypothetical protein
MDEGELLEILTNISEDLEALRREMRSRMDAELTVLRKAVNAVLPHIPQDVRARLATEFREMIAQEAQGSEPTLPKTMAVLAMPNALLPLYPGYLPGRGGGAPGGLNDDEWRSTRHDQVDR